MNFIKTTGLVALALAGSIASWSAQSATTLKIATIAPPKTPWFIHLEKWKANLEKASNGSIQLQLFPSAQLGNEFDVFKQVSRGRIDGGLFSGAVLANNMPEFSLLSTPFLFDRLETVDCMLDKNLKDTYEGLVRDQRMEPIGWGETGWINVYATDDIADIANADGYKIRTSPTPMSKTLWQSANAAAIEIPYADVPAALQTGVVKGGESTTLGYVAFGLSKVAKKFFWMRQYYQAGLISIGDKSWKKFSGQEQQMIRDALPPAAELRTALRQLEQGLMKKIEAGGGTVNRMDNDKRDAWAAAVTANRSAFIDDLGPSSKAMWPTFQDAVKSCKASTAS